jgi:UDP-N-acetylmuramoyl-L-alanyl-D-glutamate--2,6-diaminopimelate ligase
LDDPLPAATSRVPLTPLAAAIAGAEVRGGDGILVEGAAADSREVAPGNVFFCVRGEVANGHRFAADAVRGGAAALVVDHWLEVDAPQVRVADVRAAMGPMSAEVFGHPARSLTMAGVTGTNGKTTVTYLLESVFAAAGLTAGVVGTTGARIAGEAVPITRTTPEAADLHRLLAAMRDRGVQAVAMEVSSHALAQGRVDGIRFDVAGFTNLSQDHLDFHGSLEAYFAAKARLFMEEHTRHAVVNLDDPRGRALAERAVVPVTTYGMDGRAQVRATQVSVDAAGLAFVVDGVRVRSRLRGGFNVANCLCAFAIARALGLEDGAIVEGIGALEGVPGRVEPVEAGQDFLVVVDYAHTPDSIHSVLRAARPLASGRLIVVFGCGGDRDRDKRPRMGRAATSEADLTIITSDNPRSEDPSSIIADIEAGARDGGGPYVVEADRRAAIALAMGEAAPGDVVVIAGKGHERTQELATGPVPFDDRAVAAEALRARRGSA